MAQTADGILVQGPVLKWATANPSGHDVLRALFSWASDWISVLQAGNARAVVGRLRGQGPGASFTQVMNMIESWRPLALCSPFEGTDSIAGGVWGDADHGRGETGLGLAKLRFRSGTCGLPLHTHPFAERLIIVNRGRGLFHVDTAMEAKERSVRTIPIRERDVLFFQRGTPHTFSVPGDGLDLLSFQQPFIPFDDASQYEVATPVWHPTGLELNTGVSCDPAWSVLA